MIGIRSSAMARFAIPELEILGEPGLGSMWQPGR